MVLPIKLATVGCGFFSQFHHDAWQRLCSEYMMQHVGVCDLHLDRATQFAHRYAIKEPYSDFSKMLAISEPDLVDLVLPPSQHLQHIKLAAEFGCDVICQKPFTLNEGQAQEAADIARDAGIHLLVHENFRFQPWYRKIRQMIEDRYFGDIYQLHFALRPGDGQGKDAYLDRQPYFQTMPEFLIRETGVHFIDVFRFLLGDAESAWADLRKLNPAIVGEDSGIFFLKHENGIRSIFDGNRLSDHQAVDRRLTMGELTLESERGVLQLNGFGDLNFRSHGKNTQTKIEFNWNDTAFGGDCVYALQKHVIEHLVNQSPLENSAQDYMTNIQYQSAIYLSNLTGQWQSITRD